MNLRRLYVVLALVVVLAVVVATLPVERAAAQSCPGFAQPLGIPAGTYPGSLLMCEGQEEALMLHQNVNAGLPCGEQVKFENVIYGAFQQHMPRLYLVPAPGSVADNMRMRFYIFDAPEVPGSALPADSSVHIRYYHNGILTSGRVEPLHNNPNVQIIPSQYTYIITYAYDIYLVDVTLFGLPPNDAGNAWFTIHFDPGTLNDPYFIASVQIAELGGYMPDTCGQFNAVNPGYPTPTLPATYTPMPTPPGTTATPTRTPNPMGTSTPAATAPAGTLIPPPTLAPIVFPTAPSEPTPTPWQAYTMPLIQFPNITFPVIPRPTEVQMGLPTPPGFVAPLPTIPSGVGSDAATRIWQIVDEWQETADRVATMTDVITDTTGVGSPASLSGVLTEGLGRPVSYAKSLLLYLPNTAPHLAALIIMAAWVIFNIMAKPLIGIIKVLFELIRRLWEAIPLN